jgi:hypothetical protein
VLEKELILINKEGFNNANIGKEEISLGGHCRAYTTF